MSRIAPTFDELHTPLHISEWHEDFGCALWHRMCWKDAEEAQKEPTDAK